MPLQHVCPGSIPSWKAGRLSSPELRQEPQTVQLHTWMLLKCLTSPETQGLGLPSGSSWTSRAQAALFYHLSV